MSEPVIIVFIGFGGAIVGALITALLQPLWTNLVGKTSRLYVEVSYHPFLLPKRLKDAIYDYIFNFELTIRPKENFREFLREINSSSGMIKVSVSNRSKRVIDGVVISCKRAGEFISEYTVDGEKPKTVLGTTCQIGSLRPKSTCVAILWTSIDFSNSWGALSDTVDISAHEYDRIKFHYPQPYYIGKRFFLFRRVYFWNAFFVLLLLIYIASSLVVIKR